MPRTAAADDADAPMGGGDLGGPPPSPSRQRCLPPPPIVIRSLLTAPLTTGNTDTGNNAAVVPESTRRGGGGPPKGPVRSRPRPPRVIFLPSSEKNGNGEGGGTVVAASARGRDCHILTHHLRTMSSSAGKGHHGSGSAVRRCRVSFDRDVEDVALVVEHRSTGDAANDAHHVVMFVVTRSGRLYRSSPGKTVAGATGRITVAPSSIRTLTKKPPVSVDLEMVECARGVQGRRGRHRGRRTRGRPELLGTKTIAPMNDVLDDEGGSSDGPGGRHLSLVAVGTLASPRILTFPTSSDHSYPDPGPLGGDGMDEDVESSSDSCLSFESVEIEGFDDDLGTREAPVTAVLFLSRRAMGVEAWDSLITALEEAKGSTVMERPVDPSGTPYSARAAGYSGDGKAGQLPEPDGAVLFGLEDGSIHCSLVSTSVSGDDGPSARRVVTLVGRGLGRHLRRRRGRRHELRGDDGHEDWLGDEAVIALLFDDSSSSSSSGRGGRLRGLGGGRGGSASARGVGGRIIAVGSRGTVLYLDGGAMKGGDGGRRGGFMRASVPLIPPATSTDSPHVSRETWTSASLAGPVLPGGGDCDGDGCRIVLTARDGSTHVRTFFPSADDRDDGSDDVDRDGCGLPRPYPAATTSVSSSDSCLPPLPLRREMASVSSVVVAASSSSSTSGVVVVVVIAAFATRRGALVLAELDFTAEDRGSDVPVVRGGGGDGDHAVVDVDAKSRRIYGMLDVLSALSTRRRSGCMEEDGDGRSSTSAPDAADRAWVETCDALGMVGCIATTCGDRRGGDDPGTAGEADGEGEAPSARDHDQPRVSLECRVDDGDLGTVRIEAGVSRLSPPGRSDSDLWTLTCHAMRSIPYGREIDAHTTFYRSEESDDDGGDGRGEVTRRKVVYGGTCMSASASASASATTTIHVGGRSIPPSAPHLHLAVPLWDRAPIRAFASLRTSYSDDERGGASGPSSPWLPDSDHRSLDTSSSVGEKRKMSLVGPASLLGRRGVAKRPRGGNADDRIEDWGRSPSSSGRHLGLVVPLPLHSTAATDDDALIVDLFTPIEGDRSEEDVSSSSAQEGDVVSRAKTVFTAGPSGRISCFPPAIEDRAIAKRSSRPSSNGIRRRGGKGGGVTTTISGSIATSSLNTKIPPMGMGGTSVGGIGLAVVLRRDGVDATGTDNADVGSSGSVGYAVCCDGTTGGKGEETLAMARAALARRLSHREMFEREAVEVLSAYGGFLRGVVSGRELNRLDSAARKLRDVKDDGRIGTGTYVDAALTLYDKTRQLKIVL